MPYPADAVGLELPVAERQVSTRDILAYAAGLGAHDFLDDAAQGGLEALPFLCVSLEWPVVLSARSLLADRLSAVEAMRGVHAAQDSHFHRPIRPGDRLATRGRVIAARASGAGAVTVTRLNTVDAETGAPVVTSWSTSIYRGAALDGDDGALETLPPFPGDLAAPLPADAVETVVPIAREAPHVYSECARIWNPIHTERAVALAAGLPDIILHGTATWALAGLEAMRVHGRRLRRLSGRFTGMIVPGEAMTIRHARTGGDTVRLEVLNAAGAPALSQGFVELSGE